MEGRQMCVLTQVGFSVEVAVISGKRGKRGRAGWEARPAWLRPEASSPCFSEAACRMQVEAKRGG